MPIYEIEISLREIEPRIWRRIAISGNSRLSSLHKAIQAVVGWCNSHLYEFMISGKSYRQWDYAIDGDWFDDGPDSKAYQLRKLVKGKSQFRYIYDFGDCWEHDLTVLAVRPPDPDVIYPVCIGGERACPPEDVGGPWGYQDFLEAVLNPQHEEHDRMLEWIGGKFDSNAFDLDEANKRLRRIR